MALTAPEKRKKKRGRKPKPPGAPEFPSEWASVPQRAVFLSRARFRVLVAGRRFGKTVLAINELIRAAHAPGKRLWYIAPTYRMAKEIAWRELKAAIPAAAIEKRDEMDLTIVLKHWGSQISLRGADNPDRLRGVGLDLAIFDEAADMDPAVWFEVIRPALADRAGDALWIGTPKGFNWFYDLHSQAGSLPDWEAFQFTTLEGGNVSEKEIAAAQSTMSAKQFSQEFLASFEELSNRVYSNFVRAENVSEVRDPGGVIYVGMDFNVEPMSACVGSKVGSGLHIWDEVTIPNGNTEEMCREIKVRYPGRTVRVYPDPAGKSRNTSAKVGQTDFTILRDHGFTVHAPSKAPFVVDRINEVQAVLCNADGVRRLLISPRCKEVIKSLEGQTYKPGTSQPEKSGLDHYGDAVGYLVHGEFPIVKKTARRRGFLEGMRRGFRI